MNRFKRILILLLGVIFILLGLLGLVLPFLQGILFLAIGVVLLSLASQTFQRWIETYTSRYPKIHAVVKKVEEQIVKITGRPLDP